MKPVLSNGKLNPNYFNGHRFVFTDAGATKLDRDIVGRSVRIYAVRPGDRAIQVSYRVRASVGGDTITCRASAILTLKSALIFIKRV